MVEDKLTKEVQDNFMNSVFVIEIEEILKMKNLTYRQKVVLMEETIKEMKEKLGINEKNYGKLMNQ
ncbi:MAG: hypothetical protein ISS82_06235 [Nanoarchaeota archaeon]|nr:hypothetical protein [Nanoarchaeota archaeon]